MKKIDGLPVGVRNSWGFPADRQAGKIFSVVRLGAVLAQATTSRAEELWPRLLFLCKACS